MRIGTEKGGIQLCCWAEYYIGKRTLSQYIRALRIITMRSSENSIAISCSHVSLMHPLWLPNQGKEESHRIRWTSCLTRSLVWILWFSQLQNFGILSFVVQILKCWFEPLLILFHSFPVCEWIEWLWQLCNRVKLLFSWLLLSHNIVIRISCLMSGGINWYSMSVDWFGVWFFMAQEYRSCRIAVLSVCCVLLRTGYQ